tara:strand:+ start:2285 stop:2533 length:249 start_codon:yes stop_codon:yes gene_type:complete
MAMLDHNGQTQRAQMRLEPEISPVNIEFAGRTAHTGPIGDYGGGKRSSSCFEAGANNGFLEYILLPLPGAAAVEATDFDGYE